MSIRASIKRAVLARQGGRCARGAECLWATPDGLGVDLEALKRADWMKRYLPPGRYLVEFDHVEPRAQRGSDDPDNIEALCGKCHHAKTELERPHWEAPSPSALTERLAGKPRPAKAPASKTMRLRGKAPVLKYG